MHTHVLSRQERDQRLQSLRKAVVEEKALVIEDSRAKKRKKKKKKKPKSAPQQHPDDPRVKRVHNHVHQDECHQDGVVRGVEDGDRKPRRPKTKRLVDSMRGAMTTRQSSAAKCGPFMPCVMSMSHGKT